MMGSTAFLCSMGSLTSARAVSLPGLQLLRKRAAPGTQQSKIAKTAELPIRPAQSLFLRLLDLKVFHVEAGDSAKHYLTADWWPMADVC
jgi:hypothetical protein